MEAQTVYRLSSSALFHRQPVFPLSCSFLLPFRFNYDHPHGTYLSLSLPGRVSLRADFPVALVPSKNYALWKVNIRFTWDQFGTLAPPMRATRGSRACVCWTRADFLPCEKRAAAREHERSRSGRNWRLRARMGVPRGRAKLIAVSTVRPIDRRWLAAGTVLTRFSETEQRIRSRFNDCSTLFCKRQIAFVQNFIVDYSEWISSPGVDFKLIRWMTHRVVIRIIFGDL